MQGYIRAELEADSTWGLKKFLADLYRKVGTDSENFYMRLVLDGLTYGHGASEDGQKFSFSQYFWQPGKSIFDEIPDYTSIVIGEADSHNCTECFRLFNNQISSVLNPHIHGEITSENIGISPSWPSRSTIDGSRDIDLYQDATTEYDLSSLAGMQEAAGYGPLAMAAATGDLEQCRALILAGTDVDARPDYTQYKAFNYSTYEHCDWQFATPLMLAAKYQQTEVAEYLIEQGASLDIFGKWDLYTPLIYGVRTANHPLVATLLQAGAGITFPDALGIVPLAHAVEANSPQMVSLLLQNGAEPNTFSPLDIETPLMKAASNNNLEIVNILLEAGADPDFTGGHWFITPLGYAAGHNNRAMTLSLLTAGAQIDKDNEADGSLPAVMYAVIQGKEETFFLLLEKGADISRCGEALLQAAVSGDNLNIAAYLLSCGFTAAPARRSSKAMRRLLKDSGPALRSIAGGCK